MNDNQAFEEHVREVASQFEYPDTPPLRNPARKEKVAGGRSIVRNRLAWAAVTIIAVFVVGFSVPPIRAALLEIFNIGAVEVTVSDNIPPPDAPYLNLTGETTFAEVQARLNFTLRYPEDWPEPDRLYFQQIPSGSAFVVMAWLDESGQVDRALYQAQTANWTVFKQIGEMTVTEVRGDTALWLNVPHTLSFNYSGDESVDSTYLIEGNVLIWQSDGITNRLEGMPDIQSAIKAAENLSEWEPIDD